MQANHQPTTLPRPNLVVQVRVLPDTGPEFATGVGAMSVLDTGTGTPTATATATASSLRVRPCTDTDTACYTTAMIKEEPTSVAGDRVSTLPYLTLPLISRRPLFCIDAVGYYYCTKPTPTYTSYYEYLPTYLKFTLATVEKPVVLFVFALLALLALLALPCLTRLHST